MSDPEMKIDDMTEAETSAWSVQPKAATTGNGNGKVVPWPSGAQTYSLRSMRAQAEIYAITRALEEAGWNCGIMVAQAMYSVDPIGVQIALNPQEANPGNVPAPAARLVYALLGMGIIKEKAITSDPQIHVGEVVIIVGRKPPS